MPRKADIKNAKKATDDALDKELKKPRKKTPSLARGKRSSATSAAKKQRKTKQGKSTVKVPEIDENNIIYGHKYGPNFKLNKDLVKKLETYLQMGLSDHDCCEQLGISYQCIQTYCKANPSERERFNALRKVPAIIARKNIIEAMMGNKDLFKDPDYKLCQWYLEKKNRPEFGSDLYVLEQEKRGLAADGEENAKPFSIPAELVAPEFANLFRDVTNHRFTHFREPGGRGAGRSSAISLAVIGLLMNNPTIHALISRKVAATMRDSVLSQIIWAIDALGLTGDFKVNWSRFVITRLTTGQKLYFRGLDDPGKIKSIKPPFGYIGAWWLEEADQTNGEPELRPVRQSIMRGGDQFWIFESWNTPRNKQHWINERTDLEAHREDVRTHFSTYLSLPTEWLGRPFIADAEALKAIDELAYRHEYLGEAVGHGGEVFERLSIEAISDETIKEFDNIRRGIDWGFGSDPFAYVKLHYDKTRKVVFIFDELVAHGLVDTELTKLLQARGVGRRDLITADSEDPKSIADFDQLGFFMNKCGPKFKGFKEHGVKFLQQQTLIVIDPVRCPETTKEFRGYKYKVDAQQNNLPILVDKFDHTIDAVRYALNDEIMGYGPAKVGYAVVT